MKKFFDILQVFILIVVIIRLVIEFINYRKANESVKKEVARKGYPFLIITNILFAILVLSYVLMTTRIYLI